MALSKLPQMSVSITLDNKKAKYFYYNFLKNTRIYFLIFQLSNRNRGDKNPG